MILTCGCEVTTTAPARIERPCEQHGRIGLRDMLAGQALAGGVNEFLRTVETPNGWDTREQFAEFCYAMADAMLKARNAQ